MQPQFWRENEQNKTPVSDLVTDLLKCYLRIKEYSIKFVTCEF